MQKVKLKDSLHRKENKEKINKRDREIQAKFRAEFPEKKYESNKRYVENNSIKVRNTYLIRKYGITYDEYENKLIDQGGVCHICKKPPKETRRLAVDHRHVPKYKDFPPEKKKTEVRGLLCFTCNVLLGKLEKRNNGREVLMNVVEYFKIYKLKGDV